MSEQSTADASNTSMVELSSVLLNPVVVLSLEAKSTNQEPKSGERDVSVHAHISVDITSVLVSTLAVQDTTLVAGTHKQVQEQIASPQPLSRNMNISEESAGTQLSPILAAVGNQCSRGAKSLLHLHLLLADMNH